MKSNWKHIAIIVVDAVIAVYLVLAITAFNRPDDKGTVCSEVKIEISDGVTDGFLTPDGVKQLLLRDKLYPLAQPLRSVDTRLIEETLERSPYVERAECYKAQGGRDGRICIDLVQRVPVVRVMNDSGEDYYVDNQGDIVTNSRFTSDLIVATGHISQRYARQVLAPIALHIVADKFWNSQVVQLNVLPDGTLELIPRVGGHVVYLGAPTGISKKLERLAKFYKYGLNQAGWNRYSRISVDLDNQIVCKKRSDNR